MNRQCFLYGLIILIVGGNDLFGVHYNFINEPIDVVMPCHEKDVPTLDLCIDGIRKNIKNVNRIIVISNRRLTNKAEWFDEKLFPFDKTSIAHEIFRNNPIKAHQLLRDPKTRVGWIFKQIVNLYSWCVIPNVSSNILVIDTDTIFLRPVEFLDASGAGLYNPGTENHRPYFEHGARLIPGFKKMFNQYSGISHHLLFQRAVMEDLHRVISETHGVEPWRAICRCIDPKEVPGSCMADYELYFNFVFARTNQVKIRHLKWANVAGLDIRYYIANQYDYVSCHSYMR